MSRVDDWQTNLTALITERRETPFDFPKWNCLMWAFDGIKAVTDEDYGQAYRGKYQDEMSALRLLRRVDNVKTPQELLRLKLGTKLKPVAFARHGDIVFLNQSKIDLDLLVSLKAFGPVPGICYGQLSYFVGQEGLVEVETLRLSKTLWVS